MRSSYVRVMGAVRLICATLTAVTLLGWSAASAQVSRPEISRPLMAQSTLVSARQAIAPGETFTVALRQQLRDGWHTYWRNPGDAGEPVKIAWSLPAGFTAADNEWPLPQVHKTGLITDFIYEGALTLPVKVSAPADLPAGKPVELKAHISYLICQDICIPEETDVALKLDVAKAGKDDAEWAARIEAARASVPKPAAGLHAEIYPDGATYRFLAEGPALTDVRAPYFLPFASDRLDHAADQPAKIAGDKITLTLTPTVGGKPTDAPIAGVLMFKTPAGFRGIEIDTGATQAPAGTAGPPPPPPPTPGLPLWAFGIGALAFAALGFAAWALWRRRPQP